MPTILALGLAAALYPQLLAVVVVILTRPGARKLLWGCYAGCMTMSTACALGVLLVFRDHASIAGSSSRRLGASVFLVVGAIAVVIAVAVASERGRRLAAGLPHPRRRERSADRRPGFATQQKERAQEALTRGSMPVAVLVGIVLGIPGPFDLLAVGRMSRGDYSIVTSIVLIVAFNVIKFLLIEIPIISYAIEPDVTADRVDRFALWVKRHELTAVAAVLGAIGVALIVRGIGRLG